MPVIRYFSFPSLYANICLRQHFRFYTAILFQCEHHCNELHKFRYDEELGLEYDQEVIDIKNFSNHPGLWKNIKMPLTVFLNYIC
jgi:hypothetical protein